MFAFAFAMTPLFTPVISEDVASAVPLAPTHTVSSGGTERDDTPAASPATLLAFGDVMFGRYVETLMARHGEGYPFTYLDDVTAGADVVLANLEGPVPDVHRHTPDESLRFSFPPTTPATLRAHNIGVVTLANNHTADQGVTGYDATCARLAGAGVASFGHPLREDGPVFETTINGQRVAMLGFHATNQRFVLADAVASVQQARAAGGFVLATVHWGTEYAATANARQRTIGHALIDAGADVVLGHHPHVVQDVERYRDRLIFYSLGNAIFDQYFSEATQQGLAVRMTLSAEDVQYELLPLQSIRSQPRPMDGVERTAFLTALAVRSDAVIADALRTGTLTLAR